MINPFKEVNWKPDRAEKRKFALSLIIGFPCLALAFAVIERTMTGAWSPAFVGLGAIGALAGVIQWLIPQIARPFYLAWCFVACCIGMVVGNVLLSAVYYLLVTPIGILLRAAGRESIHKSFNRSALSYWRESDKLVDLQRYYRQF